jgi:hypothetical protein
MVEIGLILLVSCLPCGLSLLLLRRLEERAHRHLQAAIAAAEQRQLRHLLQPPTADSDGPTNGIGDLSCRFNARSRYLRCAVNPLGTCQACSHYEPG